MARTSPRPEAAHRIELRSRRTRCIGCRGSARADYTKTRKVTTLSGIVSLHMQVRRCHAPECRLAMMPVRPEDEGRWALPGHEFGLDVIALVGSLRYRHTHSVPEIHAQLRARGVGVSERSVTNLLDRYDELVSLKLTDERRIRTVVGRQRRVLLAIDGLAPDVGHEVLWVVRECISGEVLLARSLLSGAESELAPLLIEVKAMLGDIPVEGIVSDGQRSIRNTIRSVFPGVPHQLCQFHYLREAARPLYEADRHLKKEIKKKVRGVRQIERTVEGKEDPSSTATRAYCAAVRSAITDDSRPPLKPPGLRLNRRLAAVSASLERLEKGGRERGSETPPQPIELRAERGSAWIARTRGRLSLGGARRGDPQERGE
jgi:hypothetical protein